MSPEHRLTEGAPQPVAVFGKHPGHGDFLSLGFPEAPARRISDWLGESLGEVRELLGPIWDGLVHYQTGLRFWLGAQIGEGVAWRGVMRMSADKVGRHYPLMIAQPCSAESMPLLMPAQDFYQTAEASLTSLLEQAVLSQPETTAGLSLRLGGFEGAAQGAGGHDDMFWAMKPQDGDAAELLGEVAATDLICGATARSYWWFTHPVNGQSGVLACQGLPDPQAMSWLLSGGGGQDY